MKEKKLFTGYTIYLFILLGIVLVYLVAIYPKMTLKMVELDSQYNLLRMQVEGISPYETRQNELQDNINTVNAEYESNKDLEMPAEFANFINDAADSAGVVLSQVTITDDGEIGMADGYQGKSSTANIEVEVAAGDTPATFLKALENHAGAGFYVKTIQYEPNSRSPEQGGAVPSKAAETEEPAETKEKTDKEAKAAVEETTDEPSLLKVTVAYHTLSK